MHVSEARIRANQANSLKSCGPRTQAGKDQSRQNSLTHGLSGKGVVTPDGEAEAIARLVDEFTADLQPRTTAGSALIVQMAIFSRRMRRAAEHETATIAYQVRHAAEAFDDEQHDVADALFAGLADDPRSVLRQLRRSPEGVEKLVEAWDDLRSDLTIGIWGDEQLERAANLTGLKARHAVGTLLGALSRALGGDFDALADDEGDGLDGEARQDWAKSRLFEAIDEQITILESHYQTLDFEAIALDRAEAPGRALFDASKPACLARRYESEASRGFFRALKEFRQIEAEFAVQSEQAAPRPAPSAPAPMPATPPDRMASFRENPPLVNHEPAQAFPNVPSEEVSVVRHADGLPLSVGRPLQTTN